MIKHSLEPARLYRVGVWVGGWFVGGDRTSYIVAVWSDEIIYCVNVDRSYC